MTKKLDVLALKAAELTMCLIKAGLAYHYHRYFFNFAVKEAASIVVQYELDQKNVRGRPSELATGLSTENQLRVVEMYFRGTDLLTIHQKLLPASIDSIFYFLRLDDTAFGYRICSCGKPFVFVSLGKHIKCKCCQKDPELAKNILDVDFIMTELLENRTFDNTGRGLNAYNRKLLERMKAQLLEICHNRKMLKNMIEKTQEVVNDIAHQGSKGNYDVKSLISHYDMDIRRLKELVADYDRMKERMLPTSKKSPSELRNVDRGKAVMMQ